MKEMLYPGLCLVLKSGKNCLPLTIQEELLCQGAHIAIKTEFNTCVLR
jgi:hypothetical protein